MPIKENFPSREYEIEQLRGCLPGGGGSVSDDGIAVTISNSRLEVMTERAHPDNKTVHIVQVESTNWRDINEFTRDVREFDRVIDRLLNFSLRIPDRRTPR